MSGYIKKYIGYIVPDVIFKMLKFFRYFFGLCPTCFWMESSLPAAL